MCAVELGNPSQNDLYTTFTFIVVSENFSKIVINAKLQEPSFNYCPVAWHFCTQSSTNKMEKFQERAIRFICDDFDSPLPDHLRLNMRSVELTYYPLTEIVGRAGRFRWYSVLSGFVTPTLIGQFSVRVFPGSCAETAYRLDGSMHFNAFTNRGLTQTNFGRDSCIVVRK